MQDRVPTYPGRVKLTPVLGQENTYEMVRVDEPTQEGTPLNKANLLQDPIAKMYGLSEAAVPNDVFAFLGKYNLHWWKTSGYIPPYYTLGERKDHRISGSETFDTFTIQYASSVAVDDSGVVSLKNSTSATIECQFNQGDADRINVVPTGSFMMSDRFPNARAIYYKSADAYDEQVSSKMIATYLPEQEVTGHPAAEDGEGLVYSADKDAYPDSGTVGKTYYKYYGVPFEILTKTAAQTVIGKYVGTGTYGQNNPSTLKFPFKPRIVFIGCETAARQTSIGWIYGRTNAYNVIDSTRYSATLQWFSDSVTWYSNEQAPAQLNYTGITYHYVAIG